MATIDDLISQAQMRVNGWSANAVTSINAIFDHIDNFDLTDYKFADDILLDVSSVTIPTYDTPAADATALPTYSAPSSSLPSVQSMAGITAPDVPTFNTPPVIPDAPTILIDGLFLQNQPTDTVPSWAYPDPDLGIAALIAEMAAVSRPVLSSLTFPTITPLDNITIPNAPMPNYDPPFVVDQVRGPVDYASAAKAQYNTAVRELQAWCDNAVTAVINTYAPGYFDAQSALTAKISAGLEGNILPEQYEEALQTRARSRTSRDFFNAEQTIRNAGERLGFIDPPGRIASALKDAMLERANALAVNSNETYIAVRDKEIQHLQFTMQLSAQQQDSLRNMAIQWFGAEVQMFGQALANSELYINSMTKLFEHYIARGQFQLDYLRGTREQYDTLLKDAMARYEKTRMELDLAKSQKEVDMIVVEALGKQSETEFNQVRAYGEIIDAIAKRAQVSEIQLHDIETKSNIFEKLVNAVKTEYDIYNLALEGDDHKLKGQMAKLEKYKAEIDAITAGYQAIETALKGVDLSNDQKIKTFDQQERLYKIDLDSVVQAFVGASEKKKLAIQSFGTNAEVAINKLKTESDVTAKFILDTIVQNYQGLINQTLEKAKMGVNLIQTSTSGYQAAANVAGGIAQSSAGALNTMVNGSANLAA